MSGEKLAPRAGTAQCRVLGTTLPVPRCWAACSLSPTAEGWAQRVQRNGVRGSKV